MFQRIVFILVLISSTSFAGLDFNKYHSQADIKQYMQNLAHDNPTLVRFYNLGKSDKGNDIDYVTITKGDEQKLPAIYFNGTHHGDEWSSTEGILGLIDYLMTNKDTEQVSALLNQYVFYLQPMVNPDGHKARTREDANGKDPNRDYLYPGASSGSKFKTQIIKLERGLLDSKKFRAAAAYHSGIEEVLYPWCYTGGAISDKDKFYTIAKKAATAMGMNRVLQSYYDYPTDGEFIDYAYMTHGTIALTYEVSGPKTPSESQLDFIVKRSVKGAMAFITAVQSHDQGTLKYEKSPSFHLTETINPLWKALGMKLE